MEPVETGAYSDTHRMLLRGMILVASEIVAVYWPMRTFVYRNPLHGLEDLPFDEAVRRGRELLGGNGYLQSTLFREYLRSGRILASHLDAAIKSRAEDKRVTVGGREIAHADLLRIELVQGISDPADDTLEALIDRSPQRRVLQSLANLLHPLLQPAATPERRKAAIEEERAALGRRSSLAVFCDRVLETQINDLINREMVKWCEGFLDEGHAPWQMPGRERGFYGAWKWLAGQEWSPCGIADSRRKIARLPDVPEDALLQSLEALGIPSDTWQDYLSRHLTAMPGWAGFIKWRSDQPDYQWQEAYPADLVQYLAVRVWYERELVQKTCREELGIDGNLEALSGLIARSWTESGEAEAERFLRGDGSSVKWSPARAAWRLLALADALQLTPAVLMETPPENLKILSDWLDAFPESEHGPVWLQAFEASYEEQLIQKIRPNLANSAPETTVRHQAQTVFCIDVRSESFRRHLEAVGDYDTYGFAGFFTVFIRYRALGAHHESDQFPVIMKARNEVREVARTYHARLLSRHKAGSRLLHAGHELLHDLKENVVTPYVAVETLGWFYGLPLIGKTVFTAWYQDWEDWVRSTFVPTVATAVTVDKLREEDVQEMLVAEQRAVIRRALQERFGDRHLNLSLERLEFLRKRALDEPHSTEDPLQGALTAAEEDQFVSDLRTQYHINPGGAFSRMERITRIGFTDSEQVATVETALRMMGLTRNFARLVLFCGHGSTTDNNPFEAALDCGACGGNPGHANARVLAAMANKGTVRYALGRNGIVIPQDTYFIAGLHDTTMDTVQFYDLEDLPHTHLKDLLRLTQDLEEAGRRNSQERCTRFPEIPSVLSPAVAALETRRRSGDWSEVRPEWGSSGNAAFVIARRDLTKGVSLEGRVFLHSYDYREDASGRILEGLMTGPQAVGEWINMELYFSTVDNEVYGSGTKIYHNVVGRFGVMSGPQSDLRTGLARQTVMNGPRAFHEPMRLLTLIEAPRDRILRIIGSHRYLQHLYDNEWVHLTALDPEDKMFYRYIPKQGWTPLSPQENLS